MIVSICVTENCKKISPSLPQQFYLITHINVSSCKICFRNCFLFYNNHTDHTHADIFTYIPYALCTSIFNFLFYVFAYFALHMLLWCDALWHVDDSSARRQRQQKVILVTAKYCRKYDDPHIKYLHLKLFSWRKKKIKKIKTKAIKYKFFWLNIYL